MVDHIKYKRELDVLRQKHNLLKENITNTMKKKVVDHFILQRLKKEKLLVKEGIDRIQRVLMEDLIA